jgi:molybdopterin biosynthesis enzyme
MRPIHHTIPLAEAREIIDANIRAITRVERVPLTAAAHRVLAQDVVSPA